MSARDGADRWVEGPGQQTIGKGAGAKLKQKNGAILSNEKYERSIYYFFKYFPINLLSEKVTILDDNNDDDDNYKETIQTGDTQYNKDVNPSKQL